ncbi:MAG TPA: hypothetical protein VI318_03095 [Baekduia sp.]
MSAQTPQPELVPTPAEGTPVPRRRNAWMWISGALALVAVGLLVWALKGQSDLDGAQDDLSGARQQLSSTEQELKSTSDKAAATQKELDATEKELADANAQLDAAQGRRQKAVVAATGVAFTKLVRDLGAANEDVAATEQELESAQKTADAAEKDAASAEKQATKATDQASKAQAQADQAGAEKQVAEAKATIAKDCAKAYISAFGGLIEGGDLREKAPAVRKELAGITDDCQDAFAGT